MRNDEKPRWYGDQTTIVLLPNEYLPCLLTLKHLSYCPSLTLLLSLLLASGSISLLGATTYAEIHNCFDVHALHTERAIKMLGVKRMNADNTNPMFGPPSCSCPSDDLPQGYRFQVPWRLMCPDQNMGRLILIFPEV